MGITERKQRQLEQVRSTILEQSWQIVENEGWQALSIRRIADAIEYSTPVVYRHFESKDAIVEAFTREGFKLLADKLEKVQKNLPAPQERLQALSEAYWEFAFTNEKHYQIMFGLGIPTCEMVNNMDEMKLASGVILRAIADAIAVSADPSADPYLKFRTFWSILHGLVAIEMISARQQPELAKQTLTDAVDGFVRALIR